MQRALQSYTAADAEERQQLLAQNSTIRSLDFLAWLRHHHPEHNLLPGLRGASGAAGAAAAQQRRQQIVAEYDATEELGMRLMLLRLHDGQSHGREALQDGAAEHGLPEHAADPDAASTNSGSEGAPHLGSVLAREEARGPDKAAPVRVPEEGMVTWSPEAEEQALARVRRSLLESSPTTKTRCSSHFAHIPWRRRAR